MDVLLYITNFKISSFPFAEISKRKRWSFYAFEWIKLISLSRILKICWIFNERRVNKTHFIVLSLLIVIIVWKKSQYL